MSGSQQNTILLLTGGNTGLGYATIQALLLEASAKPYTILITSRSLARAEEAVKKLKVDESLKAGFASGSVVYPYELDITMTKAYTRSGKMSGTSTVVLMCSSTMLVRTL